MSVAGILEPTATFSLNVGRTDDVELLQYRYRQTWLARSALDQRQENWLAIDLLSSSPTYKNCYLGFVDGYWDPSDKRLCI